MHLARSGPIPTARTRSSLSSSATMLVGVGAAGESLGMDRHLKSNTAKHRTHSLFRQGCMLYDLISNMPEIRLRPLLIRFAEIINQNKAMTQIFSIV